jgi:RimJ/RimL family protein N-acetyltransferase
VLQRAAVRMAVSVFRRPPFQTPDLRDEVVALRPWRDSDVPAKFAAFSDPVVQRFSWPGVEPSTEADAWAQHREHLEAWQDGTGAEFACTEPDDDNALLGGASVHDIELDQGRASVGYWVAAHARGRGVATHAVRLLAAWAFDELGLARLQLTCGPDNVASQRVAERCGFTREALLRSLFPFKGGRRDSVVYGLLPGELRR